MARLPRLLTCHRTSTSKVWFGLTPVNRPKPSDVASEPNVFNIACRLNVHCGENRSRLFATFRNFISFLQGVRTNY